MIRSRTVLFTLALTAAGGIAMADDEQRDDTEHKPPPVSDQKPVGKAMPQSRRTTDDIMKSTQSAMVHITAAQTAIANGDKKAADRALAQSETALEPLYEAPMMQGVLSDMDDTISRIERGKEKVDAIDLAPLATTVHEYRAYVDPSVVAGIDEAAAKAEKGDTEATSNALRLARNRMAVDVAFLPVEEAYVRVLAARNALEDGDLKTAGKILRNVPIIVTAVQVTQPLVPIRFKLNAAALAAEEGNWQRARTLVDEATTALERIEKDSKATPVASEVQDLVDDAQKLEQQMTSDSRPEPQAIRDLATKTRDLGG